MLFPFLAFTSIAITFVKLGQMSVMVQVLSLAVQLLLAIIGISIVVAIWKRFTRSNR